MDKNILSSYKSGRGFDDYQDYQEVKDFGSKELLYYIWIELKKINIHLMSLSGEEIREDEIQ
jgi:hypothetical protein